MPATAEQRVYFVKIHASFADKWMKIFYLTMLKKGEEKKIPESAPRLNGVFSGMRPLPRPGFVEICSVVVV